MSPQSPGSQNSRGSGSPLRNQFSVASHADFSSRLDTRQVEGELDAIFSSGISIDCIGEADAFLVFRQPFILGRHPTVSELAEHMHSQGWTPHQEACLGETLQTLTWKKGPYLATDVRPENALVAESTGTIHPIDFIVAGKELA